MFFVTLPKRQVQVIIHHGDQKITNCIIKYVKGNDKIVAGIGTAKLSEKSRFIEIIERDSKGKIIGNSVKIVKDVFCKKTGAKLALTDALKHTNLSKGERYLVWDRLLNPPPTPKKVKEQVANAI